MDFLDGIPVGILVMDTDRRVVALNRRIREWTGTTRTEAAGRPCWEIVNHGACRENCPVPAMAPADEGQELAGSLERSPHLPVALSVTVCPLRDAGGRIVGFLESMRETSETDRFPASGSKKRGLPPSLSKEPLSPNRATAGRPQTEGLTWEEVERRLILDALVRSGGKRKEAASLLGWSRSTLWRKMKARGVVE
jgi:transcriptional regulator with PAS, ATPase and Fis domain